MQFKTLIPRTYLNFFCKKFSTLFTLFLCVVFCSPILNAQELFNPGDINGDGAVGAKDVVYWHIGFNDTVTGEPRAENNKKTQVFGLTAAVFDPWEKDFPDGINYAVADVNGNGVIDSADLFLIEEWYGSLLQNGGESYGEEGDFFDEGLYLNPTLAVVDGNERMINFQPFLDYPETMPGASSLTSFSSLIFRVYIDPFVQSGAFNIEEIGFEVKFLDDAVSWIGTQDETSIFTFTGVFEDQRYVDFVVVRDEPIFFNARKKDIFEFDLIVVVEDISFGLEDVFGNGDVGFDITNLELVNGDIQNVPVFGVDTVVNISPGSNAVSSIDGDPANVLMKVYPIPTSGKANIHFANDNKVIDLLEVYDMQGIRVHRQKVGVNRLEVDFSHLPAGVYVAKAIVGEKIYTRMISISD